MKSPLKKKTNNYLLNFFATDFGSWANFFLVNSVIESTVLLRFSLTFWNSPMVMLVCGLRVSFFKVKQSSFLSKKLMSIKFVLSSFSINSELILLKREQLIKFDAKFLTLCTTYIKFNVQYVEKWLLNSMFYFTHEIQNLEFNNHSNYTIRLIWTL